MNRYSFSALLLSTQLLTGLLSPVEAQNAVMNRDVRGMRDALGAKNLHLHLQDARTSDQLLALAKAGEFNLFADATLFSASSSPLSIDAENASLNWMLEIAAQEKLSLRRFDENTLLFWKEPDVSDVAKALVTKLGDVQVPLTGDQKDEGKTSVFGNSYLLSSTRTQEAGLFLADYLQQRGWDGNSPLKAEFLLSDLPPETASRILALARSSVRESRQNAGQSWMQNARWLSDESWQGARLLLAKPSPSDQPLLSVCITNGNSQSFLGLDGLVDYSPVTAEKHAVEEALLHQPDPENLTKLDAAQLSREAALATPVSLSVKAMPVSELLAQLQKQSGVTLNIPPGSLSGKTVTCFASKASLRQCLNALSGLYGIEWSKDPNGAYWLQSHLSTAETGLLQLGDPQWFRYWQSRVEFGVAPKRLVLANPIDWDGELMDAGIGEAALQSPDGVKISTLNPKLQTLLRRSVEEHFAFILASQHPRISSNPDTLAVGHEEGISIQVAPVAKKAATPTRTLTDNSPKLQANLVEKGNVLYGMSIYGSQVRQTLQQMVAHNNGVLLRQQQRETIPQK